jgi:hypothetical protein
MPQINDFFRTYGGEAVMFWCPGCESVHAVWIRGPSAWGFNGSYEKPTFTPSILVTGREPHEDGRERRCHTFITDGVIDFLGDCSHALAGQKRPMVPLPPEWRAEADPGDA